MSMVTSALERLYLDRESTSNVDVFVRDENCNTYIIQSIHIAKQGDKHIFMIDVNSTESIEKACDNFEN